MDTPPVLEVIDVTKRFGGVVAVEKASLRVFSQEIVGLVGGNGAGKSTLIKMISGAVPRDEGELRIAGKTIDVRTPMDAKDHGIETVYQELALIDGLDVAANIFLGRELRRNILGVNWLDEARMRSRTRELLDRLKVNLDARKLSKELSGGQRQAVALTRAIHFEAKVILMDEPTAALGVQETSRTLDQIRRFRDHGASLLVVSHDLEDIFEITDRIVVMKSGRVVGERPTKSTTPKDIVGLMMMGDESKYGGGNGGGRPEEA